MKKITILFAVLLLIFKISNAQTEKGDQTLGLNLQFYTSKANNFMINPFDNSTVSLNTKSTNFNIGPQYGYFIADKLEVGANLFYTSILTAYSTDNVTTTNDGYPSRLYINELGGNLFIRRYYLYQNKIGFRTGAYLGYVITNQKNNYSPQNVAYDYNSSGNYYFGGANLDLVYFPSKRIAITANLVNLEYERYTINATTQGHSHGDIFNASFANDSLSLSVLYVFGRK